MGDGEQGGKSEELRVLGMVYQNSGDETGRVFPECPAAPHRDKEQAGESQQGAEAWRSGDSNASMRDVQYALLPSCAHGILRGQQ